eukprot:COSAG01_NODE_331_length_18718_cov_21.881358_14_plen_95_part_00
MRACSPLAEIALRFPLAAPSARRIPLAVAVGAACNPASPTDPPPQTPPPPPSLLRMGATAEVSPAAGAAAVASFLAAVVTEIHLCTVCSVLKTS